MLSLSVVVAHRTSLSLQIHLTFSHLLSSLVQLPLLTYFVILHLEHLYLVFNLKSEVGDEIDISFTDTDATWNQPAYTEIQPTWAAHSPATKLLSGVVRGQDQSWLMTMKSHMSVLDMLKANAAEASSSGSSSNTPSSLRPPSRNTSSSKWTTVSSSYTPASRLKTSGSCRTVDGDSALRSKGTVIPSSPEGVNARSIIVEDGNVASQKVPESPIDLTAGKPIEALGFTRQSGSVGASSGRLETKQPETLNATPVAAHSAAPLMRSIHSLPGALSIKKSLRSRYESPTTTTIPGSKKRKQPNTPQMTSSTLKKTTLSRTTMPSTLLEITTPRTPSVSVAAQTGAVTDQAATSSPMDPTPCKKRPLLRPSLYGAPATLSLGKDAVSTPKKTRLVSTPSSRRPALLSAGKSCGGSECKRSSSIEVILHSSPEKENQLKAGVQVRKSKTPSPKRESPEEDPRELNLGLGIILPQAVPSSMDGSLIVSQEDSYPTPTSTPPLSPQEAMNGELSFPCQSLQKQSEVDGQPLKHQSEELLKTTALSPPRKLPTPELNVPHKRPCDLDICLVTPDAGRPRKMFRWDTPESEYQLCLHEPHHRDEAVALRSILKKSQSKVLHHINSTFSWKANGSLLDDPVDRLGSPELGETFFRRTRCSTPRIPEQEGEVLLSPIETSPTLHKTKAWIVTNKFRRQFMRDGVAEHAIKPTIQRLEQRLASGRISLHPKNDIDPHHPTSKGVIPRIRTKHGQRAIEAELTYRGVKTVSQLGNFWNNLMVEYSRLLTGSVVPLASMLKRAHDDFLEECLELRRDLRDVESRGLGQQADSLGSGSGRLSGMDALLALCGSDVESCSSEGSICSDEGSDGEASIGSGWVPSSPLNGRHASLRPELGEVTRSAEMEFFAGGQASAQSDGVWHESRQVDPRDVEHTMEYEADDDDGLQEETFEGVAGIESPMIQTIEPDTSDMILDSPIAVSAYEGMRASDPDSDIFQVARLPLPFAHKRRHFTGKRKSVPGGERDRLCELRGIRRKLRKVRMLLRKPGQNRTMEKFYIQGGMKLCRRLGNRLRSEKATRVS